MKKLLLSTAACGLVLAATPAHAQLSIDLGGYFKGYGVFADHDEGPAAGDEESQNVDFIRDTEIHMGGETTLDNGLTVGAHFEMDADGDDSFGVDESYAYFSGGWGRLNLGDEDGAAYLLQVAAPSADSNLDGIRQFVQPFNYDVLFADTTSISMGGAPGGATTFASTIGGIDYDQDVTGKSTKVTYLTPIMNGFQGGLTYTPDSDAADDLEGVGIDNVVNVFGSSFEAAARYEGNFNSVGVIVGAGYTFQELEQEDTPVAAGDFGDDRNAWNVGLDLDFGPVGVGAAYMQDDHGERRDSTNSFTISEENVFVLGADYTTGPYVIGASYYDSENTGGFDRVDTQRYTGGVTYTYGPGMTFRGSVTFVQHEGNNASNLGGGTDDEVEGTAFVFGTQINF